MDELVDALGRGEIAQAVLAEVAEMHAVGQHAAEQVGGRLGEERLAAVGDPAQASAAVYGRAAVVALAQVGLAGVQRHPHLEIGPRHRLLERRGRRDGVTRAREDAEA